MTATDDTWTTLQDAGRRPAAPTHDDATAWAHALSGLGYGLFAWGRHVELDELSPRPAPAGSGPGLVLVHAEPTGPTESWELAELAEPAQDHSPAWASQGDPLDQYAHLFAAPAEVVEQHDADASTGRSLLDEDLRAAWTLDDLPDDVSYAEPDGVADVQPDPSADALSDALAAAFAGEPEVADPPDQPEDVWSARRDTIAMLEEIAFLDE